MSVGSPPSVGPRMPEFPVLPPRRRAGHRRGRTGRSYGRALAWTVLGAVIPGTGLLAAGRRRLGGFVLVVVVILAGLAAWVLVRPPRALLHLTVKPSQLLAAGAILAILGLAWVVVIIVSHRLLRPSDATAGQRVLGSGVVAVLALAVLLPMVVGSRYAFVQHEVVTNIFASDESLSVTRPEGATAEDPWAGQDRVNVLLLGGDGSPEREGVRTDTTIVASIDTSSGRTSLFSLPRNLMNMPFPPDSPLAAVYPGGVFTGPGEQGEWMLNAIYRNVPAAHPGLLASDHPGADAVKLAVGEALGLRIDYFVLLNLDGFQELINALGGVTVNVNARVPIGGSDEKGIPPHDWIEPGPNQHLDGYHALWFARGRYGSSDYDRMDRQRCMIGAIIDQADPANVLSRYEQIARTSQDIVETDIPQALLPAFVDLALLVKDADVTSVVFDNTIITPANPDYELIRAEAQAALAEAAEEPPGEQPEGPPAGEPDQPSEHEQPPPPPPPLGEPDSEVAEAAPTTDLSSNCAYQRESSQ